MLLLCLFFPIADEDAFWYFEVLVLVFKLCMTGLFCIIARESPFQSVFAFLVCTMYSCLLLRHTPYKADDADLLALTCSFSLALTLLTGYVINATRSFLSADEDKEVLQESLNTLDVFLIANNALPFVVFILHMLKRCCTKVRDKKRGKDSMDDNSCNTKILPTTQDAKDEIQQERIQKAASDAWKVDN